MAKEGGQEEGEIRNYEGESVCREDDEEQEGRECEAKLWK